MSAETAAGLEAALVAYNTAAAEAALSGQQPPAAELAASSGLAAAAQAHADASRPLEDVLGEYAAANADPAADQAAVGALGTELHYRRMADSVLAGSYPGTAPVVSTGEGA
jgi:hypothetical protein